MSYLLFDFWFYTIKGSTLLSREKSDLFFLLLFASFSVFAFLSDGWVMWRFSSEALCFKVCLLNPEKLRRLIYCEARFPFIAGELTENSDWFSWFIVLDSESSMSLLRLWGPDSFCGILCPWIGPEVERGVEELLLFEFLVKLNVLYEIALSLESTILRTKQRNINTKNKRRQTPMNRSVWYEYEVCWGGSCWV